MKIMPIRSGSANRNILLVGGTALAAFLAMLALLYTLDPTGRSSSQNGVTGRGADAAALDPAKTVSLFQIFVDGGLQKVMATDESDQKQVAAIRAHLHEQAKKFSSGDFSDAAKLHSEEMLWLNALRAGAGEIDVLYGALPNGAQIRYTATKPELVSALHNWLMVQVSDSENRSQSR